MSMRDYSYRKKNSNVFIYIDVPHLIEIENFWNNLVCAILSIGIFQSKSLRNFLVHRMYISSLHSSRLSSATAVRWLLSTKPNPYLFSMSLIWWILFLKLSGFNFRCFFGQSCVRKSSAFERKCRGLGWADGTPQSPNYSVNSTNK